MRRRERRERKRKKASMPGRAASTKAPNECEPPSTRTGEAGLVVEGARCHERRHDELMAKIEKVLQKSGERASLQKMLILTLKRK